MAGTGRPSFIFDSFSPITGNVHQCVFRYIFIKTYCVNLANPFNLCHFGVSVFVLFLNYCHYFFDFVSRFIYELTVFVY